ncbi:hypothetical protein D3C72_2103400 [compost metagenome]
MGRQDEEVLALRDSIERERIAALTALDQGDIATARAHLERQAPHTARLKEVEQRDGYFRTKLRNLYHLMEACLKGRKEKA